MTRDIVKQHLELLPGVPLIDSPFIEEILASDYFNEQERVIASSLSQQGFAVIDFPDAGIAERADSIRQSLAPLFDTALQGGDRFSGNLMPPRFQDVHEISPDARAIASNETLLALLGKLYGRAVFPFQTLVFHAGSQQHLHSDAVHFNSYPMGFMCGVWVALEDVTPQNGPLIYCPGSHKWAVYDNEQTVRNKGDLSRPASQAVFHDLWHELIDLHGASIEEFYPQKGQALIWAANLLHGGAEIRDREASRWSQVTHYYFENCAYYRPMASHLLPGSVAFIEPVNVLTGEPVVLKYCDTPLSPEYVQQCRERSQASQEAQENDLPEGFDPERYLELNPDVAAAGADASYHYRVHGKLEGRRFQ